VLDFFLSPEGYATDLYAARERERRRSDPNARYTPDELTADLEKAFGKGSVARGEQVFAQQCARCHSPSPAR